MLSMSPSNSSCIVHLWYKGQCLITTKNTTLQSKCLYFHDLTFDNTKDEVDIKCDSMFDNDLSFGNAKLVLKLFVDLPLVDSNVITQQTEGFNFMLLAALYNVCVYFNANKDVFDCVEDLLNKKELDSSWLDCYSKVRFPPCKPFPTDSHASICRWNVICDWQNVDFSKRDRFDLLSSIASRCNTRLEAIHALCHAPTLVKQIKSPIDPSPLLNMYTFLQDPGIIWKQGEVGLIIAGGAIVSLLKGCESDDLDFFVYGTRFISDDDSEFRAILQSIFRAIDRAYSDYTVVKQIIGHLINVHVMKDEIIIHKIQFVIGPYCETPVQVVEFFDLDYVQAWYDGVSIWQTPSCLYANETNTVHIVCSLASDSDKRIKKAKAKGFQFSPLATPLEERPVEKLFDLNWFESIVANNDVGSREMIGAAALKNKKVKKHDQVLEVVVEDKHSWTLTEKTLISAYNARLDGGFPFYADKRPKNFHVTPSQTSKSLPFLTIKIYHFRKDHYVDRDIFFGYFNKETIENEILITSDQERKTFLEYVLFTHTSIPSGELGEYPADTTVQIRLDVHPATIVCPLVQGFTFPFSLCLSDEGRLDSLKKSWAKSDGLTIMARPLTYPTTKYCMDCLILDRIIW